MTDAKLHLDSLLSLALNTVAVGKVYNCLSNNFSLARSPPVITPMARARLTSNVAGYSLLEVNLSNAWLRNPRRGSK
jgi:hypothetical protein